MRCLLVEAEAGRVVTAVRPWEPVPASGAFAFDLDLDLCLRLLGEAAREALRKAGASPGDVHGIAATSMRFSLVVVDTQGRPLVAVPNRDARSANEGLSLSADYGSLFAGRAGHWPLPIFAAARLRWLAHDRPEVMARAAGALSLSDWIGCWLTGERATTPSQAAESLMLDLGTRSWGEDLIELLEVPRTLLPPVVESGSVLGRLTDGAASALGLRAGTPVAMGGADTQCGLLGAGAVESGQVAAIAGSTTPVQSVVDRPCTDPQARTWTGCHVMSEAWVLESNAGDTGEALAWLSGVLYPGSANPVSRFASEAERSVPGSDGIFSTFGAAVMNAREMGFPVGSLSLAHMGGQGDSAGRRAALNRAVLEGMAYAVRANLDQLRIVAAACGAPPPSLDVRLAGGMTRSPLWTQMVADTLGHVVLVSSTPEASALGAAICGGVGAGVYSDLVEGARALARVRPVEPHPENTSIYAGLYADWLAVRQAGMAADELASTAALEGIMHRPDPVEPVAAPAPRLRILATADLDEAGLSELRTLGDVAHVSYREALRVLSGEDLVEELQGCQVFITEADIVDVEALRELPDLRVVAACRGQAVNVDVAACTALGIPVLYAPGRNAEAVADLAVTFMLVLLRRVLEADAFLRLPGGEAGDMGRQGQAHSEFQGHELGGRTIGLVGLGAVGKAVAGRLRGFGSRILVYDPYARPADVLAADAEPATLDELLTASDIVSLHAPVTDQTRGLIGARELARMKPGAVLVNTARAALVDEVALADSLRAGRLAGAALDVFSVEPPGADHPLLALPNVVATPHMAGNTFEVAGHQGLIIAADLRRMAKGQPPAHLLNPEALVGFTWEGPRRLLDDATLDALAERPGPEVSDLRPAGDSAAGSRLQATTIPSTGAALAGGAGSAAALVIGVGAAAPAGAGTAVAAEAPPGPPSEAGSPLRAHVEKIVHLFIARALEDPALAAFAAKRDVTTHYIMSDLDLEFFIGFNNGRTTAGMGAPPRPAEVRMKARAEVFDGILTGKISGHRAAMSGKLSFNGDVRLAMGVQKVQRDLIRLYSACRDEAGGIDFSAVPLPQTVPSAPVLRVPGPRAAAGTGDGLPDEIVRIADQLFAAQLLTPTGGNISAREPGGDIVWITPSQLFKGELKPASLVRIDLDGATLDPDALTPSSERLLHCDIYKARPDVEAVIHAHAPYATVLALSGLPFLPVTTEAAFFGDIPRVPFIMPGSRDLADAVTRALGEGSAVLLQNHGLLVAAGDLRQAANSVEIIERASQLIWSCYAARKKPKVLPKDVVAMLRDIGRPTA